MCTSIEGYKNTALMLEAVINHIEAQNVTIKYYKDCINLHNQ